MDREPSGSPALVGIVEKGEPDGSRSMMPAFLGSWVLSAIIVALAIAQQAFGHLNGDNSWFILFAERVANGAKAYVDISDPNPPAGFLVYMPAVLLARATGLSAEFWTVVETFVFALLSLGLSGALLTRAGLLARDESGVARNAALWVLLFSAGFAFAEREHFALIAFLPFAAAMLLRAERPANSEDGSFALRLVAGACGGVTFCFKPYFALPLAAVVVFACVRRRSIAPLFSPENFAAAAVAIAYVLFVWLHYPDYVWSVATVAMDVYAPARYGLAEVMASPPFVFSVALLLGLAAGLHLSGFEPRAALLGMASAGFFATYVIQSKNWFNHAYPGEALGVLALAALALGRFRAAPDQAARFSRLAVLPTLIVAPFLNAVQLNLPGAEEYPGLTAAVKQNAPAHPKIGALARQLDIAHPLTRRLGGVWVGRRNALWVDNCVRQILATKKVDEETRAKLLEYAADERREVGEDLSKGKPDILLIEDAGLREWALKKPEFSGVLDGYARKAQVGDIEVWGRVGG
ncbi:MAG: hypothetical protein QM651_05075 [Rhodoblastus sp.]